MCEAPSGQSFHTGQISAARYPITPLFVSNLVNFTAYFCHLCIIEKRRPPSAERLVSSGSPRHSVELRIVNSTVAKVCRGSHVLCIAHISARLSMVSRIYGLADARRSMPSAVRVGKHRMS